MYRVACPRWKLEFGCSDVRRPNWPDSINSLCSKTCGLCGNTNICNGSNGFKTFFILFKIVEEEIVYALDKHQTVILLLGGATNANEIGTAGIH